MAYKTTPVRQVDALESIAAQLVEIAKIDGSAA